MSFLQEELLSSGELLPDAIEVRSSPKKGRYTVSKRPLKRGEIVAGVVLSLFYMILGAFIAHSICSAV